MEGPKDEITISTHIDYPWLPTMNVEQYLYLTTLPGENYEQIYNYLKTLDNWDYLLNTTDISFQIISPKYVITFLLDDHKVKY